VVDLLLFLDCTGSMDPWIDEAQRILIKLITEVGKLFQGYQFRVAFVGYRDVWDRFRQFEVHDFTTNYEGIKSFIANTKATGGGDQAEDITGALMRGSTLNFSENGTLLSFLIADAPTHGKQYHDDALDDLKDEIPRGFLEHQVKKYTKIGRSSFFTCF